MKIWFLIVSTAFAGIFAYPQVNREINEPFFGDITLEDVTFQIFTKEHPNLGTKLKIGDVNTLDKSGFKAEYPTKILTHGFLDDFHGHIRTFKTDFLSVDDFNVILVDWSKCSLDIRYELAVECSKKVGSYIGNLIQFLAENANLNLKDVHLIGHSLGAQVMSFVSDALPEKVGRISAMDPAGPLFEHVDESERLDAGDADFVDVIHTCTILYGMKEPVGHVDFYPNGGNNQAGCSSALSDCNHGAAHEYYANTIKESGRNKYIGKKCDTVDDAKEGNCFGDEGIMGYDAIKSSPGIYYLHVTEPPK